MPATLLEMAQLFNAEAWAEHLTIFPEFPRPLPGDPVRWMDTCLHTSTFFDDEMSNNIVRANTHYMIGVGPTARAPRTGYHGYDITTEERMAIGGYIVARDYEAATQSAKKWGWERRRKRKNGSDGFFVDKDGTTIAFSEFRWLAVQNLRGKKIYVGRGFKHDSDFKKVHLAKAVRRGAVLVGSGDQR